MTLLDLVTAAELRAVAVVGLAKNVGKTTTLNSLIDGCAAAAIPLGLISTGRDGERVDVLTRLPKPAITAPAGTLLATAAEVAGEGTAGLEAVETTEYVTRLGPIVIYRAVAAGRVQLVGPDTISGAKEVVAALRRLGAGLVLVDGAFDRVASAAPAVSGATILATGAAVSTSHQETLARTRLAVETFGLAPVPEPEHRAAAAGLVAEHKVGLIDDGGWATVLPLRTALERGAEVAAAVGPRTKYLVLGGSLPSSLLRELMGRAGLVERVTLVIADGTRAFADARTWREFGRRGGRLRVVDPIRLLAVTVNPFSPVGGSDDAAGYLAEVGAAVAPLPAFDVVLGQAVNAGRPGPAPAPAGEPGVEPITRGWGTCL